MHTLTLSCLAASALLLLNGFSAHADTGRAKAAVACAISSQARTRLVEHLLGTQRHQTNRAGEVSGSHTAPALNELANQGAISIEEISPSGRITIAAQELRVYRVHYCNPPARPGKACSRLSKTIFTRGEASLDPATGLLREGEARAVVGARQADLEAVASQIIADSYPVPQQALRSNVGQLRESFRAGTRISRDGTRLMDPGNVSIFPNGWIEFDVRYGEQTLRMRGRINDIAPTGIPERFDFGTLFLRGVR